MNEKRFCPFFMAAEQLRLALQQDSIPTPEEDRCKGDICAAWNKELNACGLSITPK